MVEHTAVNRGVVGSSPTRGVSSRQAEPLGERKRSLDEELKNSNRHYEEMTKPRGILAQLGEHLPYKQRVTGSSPVGPIERTLIKTTIMAPWSSG